MSGVKDLPSKECEACGKLFKRHRTPSGRLEGVKEYRARRHCSLRCGNTRREVGRSALLWRARRHKKTRCEACGYAKRLAVHHCDQDQANNDPTNLQTLCAHCHDFWHATAKRLGRTVAGRMVSLEWPAA